MHGFKPVLIDWLLRVRPRSIVEWGPGMSTEIMLKHAPEAKILSIEHDEAWLEVARQKFGERIILEHQRCDNRISSYASNVIDKGPFDFAFVDGRRRVECVLTALTCLNPGGVVLLHDICRINYMRILSHYARVIDCQANTAVFTN